VFSTGRSILDGVKVEGTNVAVGIGEGVAVAGIGVAVNVGVGVSLTAVAVGTTNASTALTAATLQAETRMVHSRMTKTIVDILMFFMS
jgi:hypothetical protein